ncbi:MAG: helix-turn-helix domain-containing protein [Clostridium sp.]|nr:helix-turn-helix domain-containing protein [Clostridium sp.]
MNRLTAIPIIMKEIFPKRMKELRKKFGLTQKAAATVLGIGQTTIANYENGTRVPDLSKISDIADLYEVSVDYLLGRSEIMVNKLAPISDEDRHENTYEIYMQSLLDGDKKMGRRILLSLLKKGVPSEILYLDFIQKSLKETGRFWEMGELPIWKEHFISEISLENMALIKRRRSKDEDEGRPILTLAPGSEQHNIGLKMISDLLEARGQNVIYLGNQLPTENIIQAIEDNKPYAIVLSVTVPLHIDSCKLLIGVLKQRFGTKCPTIIIGGMAFDRMENVAMETGADKYCKTVDEIMNVLKRI